MSWCPTSRLAKASTETSSTFRLNVQLSLAPPYQRTVFTRYLHAILDQTAYISIGWENISVVLNQADQSFKHAGLWEHGATGGVMSTMDSGKTWEFSKLNVPAMVAA